MTSQPTPPAAVDDGMDEVDLLVVAAYVQEQLVDLIDAVAATLRRDDRQDAQLRRLRDSYDALVNRIPGLEAVQQRCERLEQRLALLEEAGR